MSRILVVEDSPSQAMGVAYILEQAGMEAVLAENGAQALQCLEHGEFDLVLSDVQMPGMSGYDLCRHIRSQNATRSLPVILLTVLTSPNDILRGLECLADNYVTKPYEAEYLVERIRSTIRNRAERAERGVSVGLQVKLRDENYAIGPDLEKTLDFLLTTVDECMRMRDREHAQEMDQSRQRLAAETQRFFTLSLDMLAILGFDGFFKRLNPAWETTLGFTQTELRLRPYIEYVHPDDQAATLAQVAQGGTSFESRFRCRDGSYRRLLWSATRVDEDAVHYLAARDITRRANEEDATRLRARLQAAIARVGQRALVETDLSALMQAATQVVCEALDTDLCHLMEIQSDGSLSLRTQDAWPAARHDARSLAGYALRANEPLVVDDLSSDARFSNPAGDGGIISSVSVIVPGRDGPYGVLGTHSIERRLFGPEDTTFLQAIANVLASAIARSGAEQELRNSEERNRLLLESTAEAIYGVDLQGRCTFCNPAALHLLGYQRPDELLGRNMHALIHHSHEDATPYLERDCPIERGEVSHIDNEVLWRADGTYFYAEYWSYPVRRGEERVGGVVTFLDITGRRLLEHQFRHAQKMEAVGRLAGGIAHDFNNLLTVVTGYCELLSTDMFGVQGEGREMLGEINRAAQRAMSLTRQLLAFSRRQVVRPRVLDLNTVVGDMEKLLGRLIGSDIELVTRLASEPLSIHADPSQLEQVIANLVVNARDAIVRTGTVTLSTGPLRLDEPSGTVPPGQWYIISVRDTGTGMSPEIMAHIFEPFFTTKAEGKGTGLGLSTVFGIVQQSGAHIAVNSEVGSGTTFTVYFRPAERREVQPRNLGWLAPVAHSSETILLQEDDRELRRLTTTVLERKGYRVLQADNAAAVVSLCRTHTDPIDLILCDLGLRGMSGRELAENVAAVRPTARILLTSGYADAALGGDPNIHFLSKPYSPDKLLRTVRHILDGKGQQDEDVA